MGQNQQAQGASGGDKKGANIDASRNRKAKTAEELEELAKQYEPILNADDEDAYYVTAAVGEFQVMRPHKRYVGPNQQEVIYDEGWTIDFGTRFLVKLHQTAERDEVALLEDLLEGRLANGPVPARTMQKLAQKAKVRIIQPGLVGPPMPTWEALSDNLVVETAKNAGFLDTPDKVLHAMKYERQASKRVVGTKPGPKGRPVKEYGVPRDKVLSDLVALYEERTGTLRPDGQATKIDV